MISLRFVGGNSAVSVGIRAAEYGFWATHTEALTPENTLIGAHIDGGVMERPRDYDKGQYLKDMIVTIPCSKEMGTVFYSWVRSQIGKPYDVEAILAFVAQRDWQRPDSWFCSELMAAGLVACKWFLSPLATEFNHITPRDLLLIVSGRVNVFGA